MPVRQPTAKLRKSKKKHLKVADSRVRRILSESGFERALKTSHRRYLLVHVIPDQSSAPSSNFRIQYARLSGVKDHEHMTFAEASIACSKKLRELCQKHGNGNFPLILAFHKKEVIKAIKPGIELPTSVLGGSAFGGYYQIARATIVKLSAEAPKPGPLLETALRAFALLCTAGAVGYGVHQRMEQEFKRKEEKRLYWEGLAKTDIMHEYDIETFEEFIEDDEGPDPMTLPD